MHNGTVTLCAMNERTRVELIYGVFQQFFHFSISVYFVQQEREGRKDMEPRSEDGHIEEGANQQLPQVKLGGHTHIFLYLWDRSLHWLTSYPNLTAELSVNPQTAGHSCEEGPKCPHFVSYFHFVLIMQHVQEHTHAHTHTHRLNTSCHNFCLCVQDKTDKTVEIAVRLPPKELEHMAPVLEDFIRDIVEEHQKGTGLLGDGQCSKTIWP